MSRCWLSWKAYGFFPFYSQDIQCNCTKNKWDIYSVFTASNSKYIQPCTPYRYGYILRNTLLGEIIV